MTAATAPICAFHGPMLLEREETDFRGQKTAIYRCSKGDRVTRLKVRPPPPPPRPVTTCDDCHRKFERGAIIWEVLSTSHETGLSHYCLSCYERRWWGSKSWAPSTSTPKKHRKVSR